MASIIIGPGAPWPETSEDNPLDTPCRLELAPGGQVRQFKCIADLVEHAVKLAWTEFDGDLTTYTSWLDAVVLDTKMTIARAEQDKR